jgi:predicted MFS family arabinose efflux permease
MLKKVGSQQKPPVKTLERKSWFPLLLLTTICVTYFIENFLRTAASALTPVLLIELGINKGTMGLLISAYFLIYGIMQIPAGIFTDTFGPRKTILSFTALTVVGVFLFWVSYRLELLFAAQFIIGIGCSVFYINAVSIITHWFPLDRKATAIGILSASSGLGNFTSYMGFPLANTLFGGWRNLYFLMAIVLVANYVMNYFILKNNPNNDRIQVKSSRNLFQSFMEVVKDRRMYPFLIGYMLLGFSWVFLTWMPQFLVDTKNFTYIQVGIISSIGTIAGIPGCIAIGFISDKLKKRKLPLVVFSSLYVILLVVFLVSPSWIPIPFYIILSASMSFVLSLWILFFSMIPEILPPEKANIGLGILNGFGTIGFSLVTPIYGGLIDATGGYSASTAAVLASGIIMTAIIVVFTKETYGGLNKK